MFKKREFQGYWWLPDQPDKEVGGIARFSPRDGATLELFSSLKEGGLENFGSDNVFNPEFIHGITTDGEKITLKNCFRENYSFTSSQGVGTSSSKFKATSLLSGAHFTESVEFDRFRVQFPLLHQWTGITGVNRSYPKSEEDTFAKIKYEFPDSITVDLDNAKLKLVFNSNVNMQPVGGGSINEEVFIDIIPEDNDISYKATVDYAKKLQDFITLATSKQVQASKLLGRLDRDDIPGYYDVEILFSTTGKVNNPDSLHPLKANFLLQDIIDDFSEVVNNWFVNHEKLEPVFNLYFSVQYNSEMYLQNQFISLTQAIETYHRREVGGKYLSNDEFEEFYNDLCDRIPDHFDRSFRDHLKKGTFKYANEFSLRRRLNELISEHEAIINELPMDIESRVREIVNTRNYLTHYDDDISPRADVDELYPLSLRLKAILETILLSDLGIPENHIAERLKGRYSELTEG